MMPNQSAPFKASGEGKRRNSSLSGLMAEGRCVQPGCQGVGFGRMHVSSYVLCCEHCYQRK